MKLTKYCVHFITNFNYNKCIGLSNNRLCNFSSSYPWLFTWVIKLLNYFPAKFWQLTLVNWLRLIFYKLFLRDEQCLSVSRRLKLKIDFPSQSKLAWKRAKERNSWRDFERKVYFANVSFVFSIHRNYAFGSQMSSKISWGKVKLGSWEEIEFRASRCLSTIATSSIWLFVTRTFCCFFRTIFFFFGPVIPKSAFRFLPPVWSSSSDDSDSVSVVLSDGFSYFRSRSSKNDLSFDTLSNRFWFWRRFSWKNSFSCKQIECLV